ncbi:hypothetical protein HCJ58_05845 [Listeria sp. FSL L7-1509]|uniref:DUF3592 domain-containing protein n=1 Tax=Listeria immobilis TaxID=2713502 RepID=A0ABR6SU55_9LIST|nr:DUF3592 domain-containing protein [Listeria immobilis]MBC1506497.1 hypothetical protein [Listeria immobilis]MBC1509218.1 hypothetical protein [Listeria immobilis]MBC6311837.1 hypothetical protein [Listeria immobilis]
MINVKKWGLRILVILIIILVLLWATGILKLSYVNLNDTETVAEITQIKRTIEEKESGDVYKFYITYKTKDQQTIKTHFRKAINVYEANYYQVGNKIKIRYSNWTPSVCVAI